MKELIKQNIFIYDFDIEDGEIIGEFVRHSVGRYDENIKLLRYNNHFSFLMISTNSSWSFVVPVCYLFQPFKSFQLALKNL